MITPRTDCISTIQSRIAEEIGPQRYKVWFKNATQLTVTDGHLKISTPNAFICGWVEKHFGDTISQVAREVTGSDVQVSFVVEPKLLHSLRKRQLNSQADFIAKNPERVARQYRRTGTPPPQRLRGRFDDLVVGPANELAVSVVRRIADRDPGAYSPAFIHGGCGVGKTHILQALANCLAEHHPECRWVYVTGDEFTNGFVHALQTRQIESFRQQYRNLDVLIIDDVHFLANKKATQEEFLHTFNAIDGQRKQVVLASDSHPKLIGQFSEHLLNRFVAGMVVRVDVPDFRMRCDILNHRSRMATSQPVPPEVIAYIAEHLQANVRELEGALLKLIMFSRVSHQPITLSLARHALSDHLARTQRSLGLDDIDQVVATYFGLTPADLHTSRKTRTLALARNIAMYLARKHTRMSFPEIGRFMGDKNHSTVILANRKIERLLHTDEMVSRQTPAGLKEERLREIVERIEEQIARHRHATHSASGQPAAASSVSPVATNRPPQVAIR